MEVNSVEVDVNLTGATVVVGMLEGLMPAPGSDSVLESIDNSLFDVAGFEGKSGQILKAPHGSAASVLVVGLGEEASFESVRSASGAAMRSIETERVVSLLSLVPVEGAGKAVVEGAVLGGYRFDRYRTSRSGRTVQELDVVDVNPALLAEALAGSTATNMARDWVNTPALDKSPEALAALIADSAPDGVSADVWDEGRIRDEQLGGVLGVAAGSRRPPRVVVLEYRPEGEPNQHLVMVGKGIVFDSGGLTIKPGKSMETMKSDMAGAAVTAASTFAVASIGLPVDVTTIIPITDNAVGGNALRPGDVLRPVAGPTIEVLNTDAEGRLILADGLGIAQRYEPDLLVDVATLTGAASVALGKKIGALLASDPVVAGRVLGAASRAGEHLWELPLFQPYMSALESDIADMKNTTGSRFGGAIAAALFLSKYVGDGDWAHLDIAGPAMSTETSGEEVKGATGYGVRTLVELAKDMADSG